LQLLKLPAHVIDRLVELMHPFMQLTILLVAIEPARLPLPGLARIGGCSLPSGHTQHALMAFMEAALFRLPQQPPAQPCGTENSPSHGTDKDRAAAVGGEVSGVSHGKKGRLGRLSDKGAGEFTRLAKPIPP
jgi:hypothetical protein